MSREKPPEYQKMIEVLERAGYRVQKTPGHYTKKTIEIESELLAQVERLRSKPEVNKTLRAVLSEALTLWLKEQADVIS